MNQVAFAIIAEILFLVLVASMVWTLIVRRRLVKQLAVEARLNNEIAALRQRLQLTHEHLQTANKQIEQLKGADNKPADQLVRTYQQRIANLEKFKELYFDLEKRLHTPIDSDELERYKQRAQELEEVESRLQVELNQYRRRVEELESKQSSAATYGVVRLKEIEELNSRLKQRENEIRRLRQECETVGIQYEELAMKSLALASERPDLTDAQKAQLEELKRKLEDNAAALARKQAECEMLENYYLELEESAAVGKASAQMQQTYAERNALQEQRRNLSNQVEIAAGPEVADELTKLRQALAEKESALDEIRHDYREVKEQFVQVAQEESELRDNYQSLAEECEKLKTEVAELSATRAELLQQKEELQKLRDEYAKMESRYLALVDKYR